jgi:hypothetical protein
MEAGGLGRNILFNPQFLWKCLCQFRTIAVFPVFRLLTDFVCLLSYEFFLSLWKIARCSVSLTLLLYKMKYTAESASPASIVFIYVRLDNNDTRDNNNFVIVNFSYLDSNMPIDPSHGVNISQHYVRACKLYSDQLQRHVGFWVRIKASSQVLLKHRLILSFKMTIEKYQHLVNRYSSTYNEIYMKN